MHKDFDSLNVIDDFLATSVTSDPEVGELFVRTILKVLIGKDLGRIKVTSQKTLPAPTPDNRGIRLDVEIIEYGDTNDTEMSIYNLEPNKLKYINLPKKNRFYQARIDSRYLHSGDRKFDTLPHTYIITITDYDVFGKDYMVYRVHNVVENHNDLTYDDDLEFLYFYTGGTHGGSEELSQMLRYLQNSTVENVTNADTNIIHNCINKVKTKPEKRDEYMHFEDLLYYTKEEGRIEGKAEGKAEGKTEGETRKLLSLIILKLKKGKTIDIIADELETDANSIKELYNAIVNAAPDYNIDVIVSTILKQSSQDS